MIETPTEQYSSMLSSFSACFIQNLSGFAECVVPDECKALLELHVVLKPCSCFDNFEAAFGLYDVSHILLRAIGVNMRGFATCRFGFGGRSAKWELTCPVRHNTDRGRICHNLDGGPVREDLVHSQIKDTPVGQGPGDQPQCDPHSGQLPTDRPLAAMATGCHKLGDCSGTASHLSTQLFVCSFVCSFMHACKLQKQNKMSM